MTLSLPLWFPVVPCAPCGEDFAASRGGLGLLCETRPTSPRAVYSNFSERISPRAFPQNVHRR